METESDILKQKFDLIPYLLKLTASEMGISLSYAIEFISSVRCN